MLYPFYAGIIGIMTGTGLVDTVTASLLSIATTDTFPVIAWVTAAVLNVFVPSAGGEWAMVGGPMLVAGGNSAYRTDRRSRPTPRETRSRTC